MQVNFLCGDDPLLVSLHPQHLKDLTYLFSFIIFNNSISLRIRLMNLTTLFGHFHKLLSFELFLFFKYSSVLLIQVIPNFLISWLVIPGGASRLWLEQWLACLGVYIF